MWGGERFRFEIGWRERLSDNPMLLAAGISALRKPREELGTRHIKSAVPGLLKSFVASNLFVWRGVDS
jgi:hypothetical protein